MKSILIIIMSMLLFGCADMNTRTLQAISTGLLIADYGQTKYIAENPDYEEQANFILGKNPDEDSVNILFGTAIVINLLVGELAPKNFQHLII